MKTNKFWKNGKLKKTKPFKPYTDMFLLVIFLPKGIFVIEISIELQLTHKFCYQKVVRRSRDSFLVGERHT